MIISPFLLPGNGDLIIISLFGIYIYIFFKNNNKKKQQQKRRNNTHSDRNTNDSPILNTLPGSRHSCCILGVVLNPATQRAWCLAAELTKELHLPWCVDMSYCYCWSHSQRQCWCFEACNIEERESLCTEDISFLSADKDNISVFLR